MAKEYDVKKLKELVNSRNVIELKQFMKDNDLIIDGNMIVSKDANEFAKQMDFFDKKQYVKKIELNASYGSLLNDACVFFDFRMGSSTTMSGRKVWQHLSSAANNAMVGKYEINGSCQFYGDTDSKKSDTKQWIRENGEEKQITVEELFNKCVSYYIDDVTGKEYGFTPIEVLGYNSDKDEPQYYPINYVYRHKTNKPKWEIEDENGNIVTVTNDHSCMVERNGKLIVVKPFEIKEDDILITIDSCLKHCRSKIKRCECVGNFNNEYVYDIGIHDNVNQWEFSNNILVHNSCYMSIDNDEFRKVHPDFDYSKDHLVQYADEIADKINASFPEYMEKAFHCQGEAKELEKAGREVVASSGLFVAKKRYSLMMIDKDGWRLDTNGKPGKIKNMGLQTQRSDSPLRVRVLLKKMLESLLVNGSKEDLLALMKTFAEEDWCKLNPWEKGRPKACNNLTQYYNEWSTTKKCKVGAVMAAINWNVLIDMYKDKKTPKILDGNKVIVCNLKKNNPYGMKSIAYPVDLNILPQWFKDLPFDEQSMKDSIVDKTIETVFGVLDWKLTLENALNDNNNLDGFLTYV